jgi:hypothetical protein
VPSFLLHLAKKLTMSRVSLRDGRDETAAERANGMRIVHPSLAQQEGLCRSAQADPLVGVGRQTTECNYMIAPAWEYNCLAANWIRGTAGVRPWLFSPSQRGDLCFGQFS